MDHKGNAILMLLHGKKPGADEGDDGSDGGGDGAEALEPAAQDLLDAIESKDAKAVAAALHDAYSICESSGGESSGEGEEPEGE